MTPNRNSAVLLQRHAAGNVVTRRSYDPWGNSSGPGGYAFTGREWDAEIGTYYYRARYYDADLGRFVSEDPSGFRAGANFYAYVENGSTVGVDPLGLGSLENPSWCALHEWEDTPACTPSSPASPPSPPPPPPAVCYMTMVPGGVPVQVPCKRLEDAGFCMTRCIGHASPWGVTISGGALTAVGLWTGSATAGVGAAVVFGGTVSYCYLHCRIDPCAY